jgi:hypothetical protein
MGDAVVAEEAQLSIKQSKLPLFHAEDKNGQFTGTAGMAGTI